MNITPITNLLSEDLSRLRSEDGYADNAMHLKLVTELKLFFNQFKIPLTTKDKQEAFSVLDDLFNKLTEVEYNYAMLKYKEESEKEKLNGHSGAELLMKLGFSQEVVNQYHETDDSEQEQFITAAIEKLNQDKASLWKVDSLGVLKKRMQFWGSTGFATDVRNPVDHRNAIDSIEKFERLCSRPERLLYNLSSPTTESTYHPKKLFASDEEENKKNLAENITPQ